MKTSSSEDYLPAWLVTFNTSEKQQGYMTDLLNLYKYFKPENPGENDKILLNR